MREDSLTVGLYRKQMYRSEASKYLWQLFTGGLLHKYLSVVLPLTALSVSQAPGKCVGIAGWMRELQIELSSDLSSSQSQDRTSGLHNKLF